MFPDEDFIKFKEDFEADVKTLSSIEAVWDEYVRPRDHPCRSLHRAACAATAPVPASLPCVPVVV